MKKNITKGQLLQRGEQRNITGGIVPVSRCRWICKTPSGNVSFPVDTCNIQWLIDPCIQYGGETRGCLCLSAA